MEQSPYQIIKLRPITQSELNTASWLDSANCQLFYNEDSNKFLLNDYKHLTLIHRGEQLVFDAKIRVPIYLLTYSEEYKAIAYCTDRQGGLVYRSLKSTSESKLKDPKNVLHIEWLSSKCMADFVVVEALGLRFLKLEDQKKGFKEIKFVPIKVSACWFQHREDVLVTSNFGDKGMLSIFYLRDKKNKNLYKTENLQLEFKEKGTKFKAGNTFTHQALFSNTYNEPFQLQLMFIYNRTVIVILNLIDGVLEFYQVDMAEIVKLPLVVNLPTDSPAVLTTYDDLILIHLKNDNISFVYDTRRTGTQPVATPAAIGDDSIYKGELLNRWVVLPDKRVFKWQIEPEAIFKYIRVEGELFMFLMRRRNCKMILLKWIRDCLFAFKATIISNFFKMICSEHGKALAQGDKDLIDQSISPTDLYANLFFPLQFDLRKDLLVDLILEVQRQLNVNRLETPVKLQVLIVQLLIDTKRQQFLAQLVQSRLIDDNKEIALQLFQHSKKSDRADILQQVAIDVLYRRNFFSELVNVFVEMSLISQLVRLLRQHSGKIPIQALISAYRQCRPEGKERLKLALKDLGRELYPASSEQALIVQLEK